MIATQKLVAIYWSNRSIYNGGPTPGTTGPGSADASLIGFFLNHLGGSNYYDINTTYTDNANNRVHNALPYTSYWASNTGVPASGTSVSHAAVQQKITSGFTSGAITYDPNTLYLVFSDAGVNLGGGFVPGGYCARHSYYFWGSKVVMYAEMPHDIDIDIDPNNESNDIWCNHWILMHGSPNSDAAADIEVNALGHEIEEANTDPFGSAWYDNSGGYENADKCWRQFDPYDTLADGSRYDMTLGGKNFLVQQVWEHATIQGCATQAVSSVVLAPSSASVCTNSSNTFTSTVSDQIGNTWTLGTTSWAATGVVSTSPSGTRQVYANTGNTEGPGTVTATLDGISATSNVTVAYCVPSPPSVTGPYSMTRYQYGRFSVYGGPYAGTTPYSYQFQKQECPQFDSGCGPWQSWVSTGSNAYWDAIVYSCGVQHIYVRAEILDARGNWSSPSTPFYAPISNPC